jgi:hypothetical protein
MTSEERRRAAKGGPTARVASALAVSLQVTIEDASVMLTSGAMAGVTVRNGSPSDPVSIPADDRAERALNDPLVVRGSDYARASWSVLRGLQAILSRRGDAPSTDAAERLEEMCVTIASKVFRAVSSALDIDFDPADGQSDANGSAKVALLLIDESRQAWQILLQPGRAVADGAPARFVATLDVLETELVRRFPKALDFKRPGFDCLEILPGLKH